MTFSSPKAQETQTRGVAMPALHLIQLCTSVRKNKPPLFLGVGAGERCGRVDGDWYLHSTH